MKSPTKLRLALSVVANTKSDEVAFKKREMKSQHTNSTFAIRTSRHTDPKLQKSYFFPPLKKMRYF